ncbi:MAG: SDR family oxidoreductase [Verrucomicrobiota bacterium]|nr:SDR family oxidoreductase [Verrucomicrobiota bacterium]
MQLDGCSALITGASAGLGREFARQLAPRAKCLVLVARRNDRLEEVREELLAAQPQLDVKVRVLDLAKTEEVDALPVWLGEQGIVIDLLINNAGVGDHGTFATSAIDRVTAMLAVNITALTSLTHALLPPMIAQRRGAVLNVSSSASFLPLPRLGVYAATKAYVSSFSEALRMEVRGTGVSVTALCPGPVHTEFESVAARADGTRELAPEFTYVTPEQVVREALTAVERDNPMVIPGFAMKVAMTLVRLTPMPVLRLAARLAR